MPFGPYAYANNGLSFRAVDANYTPVSGEVVFQTTPDSAALTSAFAGYTAAKTAQDNTNAGYEALAAGLEIQSTGTPGLNGTYNVNTTAQQNLGAITTYILVNNTFPTGGSMVWLDKDGAPHQFNDVATFKAFATAIANYATAVTQYAESGGQIGSLPSQPVTII